MASEHVSAQRIAFGAEGNAAEYLRQGWATPEAGFTWTTETTSRIELPHPGDGDFGLRLVVGPFVVADRLESQRITIVANGIKIGSAMVAERSLIDCELPQRVLAIAPNIGIDFILPDAARPQDLIGSDDFRTLGLAFESLELLPAAALADGPVEAVELQSSEAITVAAWTEATGAVPDGIPEAPLMTAISHPRN